MARKRPRLEIWRLSVHRAWMKGVIDVYCMYCHLCLLHHIHIHVPLHVNSIEMINIVLCTCRQFWYVDNLSPCYNLLRLLVWGCVHFYCSKTILIHKTCFLYTVRSVFCSHNGLAGIYAQHKTRESKRGKCKNIYASIHLALAANNTCQRRVWRLNRDIEIYIELGLGHPLTGCRGRNWQKWQLCWSKVGSATLSGTL